MNSKTRISAGIAALALCFSFVGGPAMAATSDSSAPGGSSHKSTAADHPLNLKDPKVKDHLEKIKAKGGVVLSAQTVDYQPVGKPAKGDIGVTPTLYPSGCGMSVILYRASNRIVSSSLTSCSFVFTSGEMDSWIGFYAWLNWNNVVASNNRYSGAATSYVNEYAYFCKNSNNTSYHTETYGDLLVGGTIYRAAAYDEVYNQNCGT